jgi:hypothetical protein
MKQGIGILIIVIVVILLGAAAFFAVINRSETTEKTYESSSGISEIAAVLDSSAVEIYPSTDNLVHITYSERKNDNTVFEENGTVLKITRKSGSLFGMSFGVDDNYIRIAVPKTTTVIDLTSGNGKISANGFSGESISLKTTNGAVEADGITADTVTLKTTNGAIDAEHIAAALKLSFATTNGSIEFDNIKSGDITLKTTNGAIEGDLSGKASDYAVSADTVLGKSNLKDSTGGIPLRVSTTNGSIDIEFDGIA